MDFFNDKAQQGTKRRETPQFTEYRLREDYDLQGNNRTTICMDALESAERKAGLELERIERLTDENDPRDLYEELERAFGPGFAQFMEFLESVPPR